MPPAPRVTHTSETIGEEVRERLGEMTPSERRVARTLLATYPTAGLESLPQLADGAGVTGPTVLRFVRKIGFDGYPDFQRSLRREVQARTEGLPSLYGTKGSTQGDDVVRRSHEAFMRALDATLASSSLEADLALVVSLLCDRKRRLWFVGRAVQPARRHATSACSCRCSGPGCAMVGEEPQRRVLGSLEVSRRDVLCLFDYRRYQLDTIAAGKLAAGQGAVVVVFTDPWLSPGRRVRSARADLPRGLGIPVRLAAGRVRARRGDRGEGGGRRSATPAARGSASSRRPRSRCTAGSSGLEGTGRPGRSAGEPAARRRSLPGRRRRRAAARGRWGRRGRARIRRPVGDRAREDRADRPLRPGGRLRRRPVHAVQRGDVERPVRAAPRLHRRPQRGSAAAARSRPRPSRSPRCPAGRGPRSISTRRTASRSRPVRARSPRRMAERSTRGAAPCGRPSSSSSPSAAGARTAGSSRRTRGPGYSDIALVAQPRVRARPHHDDGGAGPRAAAVPPGVRRRPVRAVDRAPRPGRGRRRGDGRAPDGARGRARATGGASRSPRRSRPTRATARISTSACGRAVATCSRAATVPPGWRIAGEAFVAGILRELPALVAVAAPTCLSYLRLQPHHWSGAMQCWGTENREAVAPVHRRARRRRPPAPPTWRSSRSTARRTPTWRVGAMLAAGLHGLEEGERLPPSTEEDPTPALRRGPRGAWRAAASRVAAGGGRSAGRVRRAAGGDGRLRLPDVPRHPARRVRAVRRDSTTTS